MTDPQSTPVQLILDIGTHKILGLAVRQIGGNAEVLASSMARHSERSIRDRPGARYRGGRPLRAAHRG